MSLLSRFTSDGSGLLQTVPTNILLFRSPSYSDLEFTSESDWDAPAPPIYRDRSPMYGESEASSQTAPQPAPEPKPAPHGRAQPAQQTNVNKFRSCAMGTPPPQDDTPFSKPPPPSAIPTPSPSIRAAQTPSPPIRAASVRGPTRGFGYFNGEAVASSPNLALHRANTVTAPITAPQRVRLYDTGLQASSSTLRLMHSNSNLKMVDGELRMSLFLPAAVPAPQPQRTDSSSSPVEERAPSHSEEEPASSTLATALSTEAALKRKPPPPPVPALASKPVAVRSGTNHVANIVQGPKSATFHHYTPQQASNPVATLAQRIPSPLAPAAAPALAPVHALVPVDSPTFVPALAYSSSNTTAVAEKPKSKCAPVDTTSCLSMRRKWSPASKYTRLPSRAWISRHAWCFSSTERLCADPDMIQTRALNKNLTTHIRMCNCLTCCALTVDQLLL
ncbi:hypothetical protein BKA62DRAFT_766003 [Auriculariales sp. MPI-PUGE-AT-0066]|nr:hypothetical protein BKA62DRAFT_766003 [Auriculariales sp. MPI-PUGE-AT-0066]